MKLTIQFDLPHTADGIYSIKASGCVMASLWWGDENGVLPEWTAFAYVPLSANGDGIFKYTGGRAVPAEADRVIARCISADGTTVQEISADVHIEQKAHVVTPTIRLCVGSDLHFNEKRKFVTRALNRAENCDAILLAGDMTNDGTSAQLRLFGDMLKPYADRLPIFAVAGNHDFPFVPEEDIENSFGYYDLQNELLKSAEIHGLPIECADSGAYAVRLKDVEIIGLNCVTDYRKFKFPEGQIDWLGEHLNKPSGAKWHIILCHAPLIAHNPQRAPDSQPYLNKDIKLQRIINEHQNIVFISGHTHFSPNDYNGCVDYDAERNIVYINDGCVCPTTSKWSEPMVPNEWCDGVVSILSLSESGADIVPISVKTGRKISRGYYFFNTY